MTDKEIQQLIDSYLKGTTSPEEERLLAHELLRHDIPEEWKAVRLMLGELAMGEAEYDNIMANRKKKATVITLHRRWIAAAASLLLIIGIGATLWWTANDNVTTVETLVAQAGSVKVSQQPKIEEMKKEPVEMKKKAETVDSMKIIKEQYRMPRPPKHYLAQVETTEPELMDEEEQIERAVAEELRQMEMEMMAQMKASMQSDFMEITNEIRQRGERVTQRVEMALNDE
jgi:hypothetical protein